MIALYINNILADIPEDASVVLSRSFEKNGNSDYSYSFELPSTATNQRIFSSLNKLESANKQFLNYSARLEINGIFAFNGFVRVDSCNEYGYSVNLVGGQSNNVDELFNDKDKLNEIRLDNAEWKVQFIDPYKARLEQFTDHSASVTLNQADKGWCYPFALWSHPYNIRNGKFVGLYRNEQAVSTLGENTADIDCITEAEQVLLPFFNVPSIIRSIFASKGYAVQGNMFDDSSIFKNLYECFAGTYEDYTKAHNQRFSAMLSLKNENKPNYNTALSYWRTYIKNAEKQHFNPLTLAQAEGSDSITYYVIRPFGDTGFARNMQGVGNSATVTAKEFYTPRDKENVEKMIKTDTDGNKKVKILKSGWYNINMIGKLVVMNTETHASATNDDVLNFDRNIYEINVVKNGNTRYFSGVFTSDSTCIGKGYMPTMDFGRFISANVGNNEHFTKSNGDALPFSMDAVNSGNECAYSFLRTRTEKMSGYPTEDFFGDPTYLNQFVLPRNEGTLFVDNKDFVCGVRVGNFMYHEDDGEKPNKNRNAEMQRFNLPVIPTLDNVGFGKAIRYGVSGQGVKQNVYKYHGNNPQAYDYIKDMDIFYRARNMRNQQGELLNENFESDTHLGNTMLNLCSSKGYTKKEQRSLGDIDGNERDFYALLNNPYCITDEYLANGDYYENDITTDMSVERHHKVYGASEFIFNTFNFNNNNVVWLDKDDELEIVMLMPGYFDHIENDTEEVYSNEPYYIDLDVRFDYIGESRENWQPTQSDMATADRPSYMHQYLQNTTCSEWLKQITNALQLTINLDNINKVAVVNYNQKQSNSGVVDITKYIDFDSVSFEPNNEPKKISIKYADSDKMHGVTTEIEDTIVTTNSGDDSELTTKYEYPATEQITIQGNTYTAPVICKEDVWKLEYPNADIFDMSGSGKPRLYFASGRTVDYFDNVVHKQGTEPSIIGNINNTNIQVGISDIISHNRKWKEMVTKNGDIDLQRPSSIIRNLWHTHGNNEAMIVKSYLPTDVYAIIKRDTIIFVDGMRFDCVKIDNYNVGGDLSCDITLIKKD